MPIHTAICTNHKHNAPPLLNPYSTPVTPLLRAMHAMHACMHHGEPPTPVNIMKMSEFMSDVCVGILPLRRFFLTLRVTKKVHQGYHKRVT